MTLSKAIYGGPKISFFTFKNDTCRKVSKFLLYLQSNLKVFIFNDKSKSRYAENYGTTTD